MSNPLSTAKELFRSLHQDAIIWKAKRLWATADDPDAQAAAMEDLVEMLAGIDNEFKRDQYIEMVQQANSIRGNHLKKGVKELLHKREQKKQSEIVKKKLEAQYKTSEDAGLQAGFSGNIHDAIRFGIYEHEGVYYTRGAKGGDYPVSNFTMKILYHVNTSAETAYRLIVVKNVYGFESFINMNTDDFVALGSFKKVLARRGDYIWKGNDSDLSRLQEYLQRDEVSTIYINTLGWQKRGGFYAFANGVVMMDSKGNELAFVPADEYGIIKLGEEEKAKHYFIPAVSKMFADKDDMFVNEKRFIYRYPVAGFGFEEWASLYCQTYGKNGIAGILFFIASLYRDIVMRKLQRFPILSLFGQPGSGKGSFADSIMWLFGEKQDQIMLGGASTVVGFMRKFAQFRNAVVWLDEYKNNLPPKFVESLKNLYDGKGYERGKMTNDFTTESTPIESACILSGQEMPTIEPALFTRVILLTFEQGVFTEQQKTTFQKLIDVERKNGGLSHITAQLVQHRDAFEKSFLEHQRALDRSITKNELAAYKIEDRMITNISVLLAAYKCVEDRIKFPFTFDEAKFWLIDNMKAQHQILSGNTEVATFWEVVQVLFVQGIIKEDIDFHFDRGQLFLRLMQVYAYYAKEMRQRGNPNSLAKSSLERYLQLDAAAFIEHKRKRFPDGSNNHCFVFRYEYLQDAYQMDLIRLNKSSNEDAQQFESRMAAKYRQMGVRFDGDKVEASDELPFGKSATN